MRYVVMVIWKKHVTLGVDENGKPIPLPPNPQYYNNEVLLYESLEDAQKWAAYCNKEHVPCKNATYEAQEYDEVLERMKVILSIIYDPNR